MKALATAFGLCIVSACLVRRPSEGFECAVHADCSDSRTCVSGYCVVPNCPAACSSCDEAERTCAIDCTSASACAGILACPSGWDCTVNCIGLGACGDVVCETGSTCTITCSGAGACGAVDCKDACKCDLACATGSCGATSCPSVGAGSDQIRCTADGTPNAPCESAHDPGCTKC